jgi:hypothetical protein
VTAPTQGLDQIARRFGGDLAAEAEAGLSFEASFGKITRHYDRLEKQHREMWDRVSTVPVLGGGLTNLVATSGVIDFPDRFGPHEGYWWDVGRLSCWGFTAGTVFVYRNDATGAGEQLAEFTTPGQWTWGHRQMPLAPRDRLVVVATAVTGSVFVAGSATQVRADHWPYYVD